MDDAKYALHDAYQTCMALTRRHYENFPVASILLPAHLRKPISVIYAFARTADDFADEDNLSDQERLAKLEAYYAELDNIEQGKAVTQPLFLALADVIQMHDLSIANFRHLLDAFKQDVSQKRYRNFHEVHDYCSKSANPVGRIILELYKQATPENIIDSDRICTALQLINFYQDIVQDFTENNRIYLPLESLQNTDIAVKDFMAYITSDDAISHLYHFYHEAEQLMIQGSPLALRLPGRLGFEIRMTVWSGLAILQKLKLRGSNIALRPRLKRRDWLAILYKSLARTKPVTV